MKKLLVGLSIFNNSGALALISSPDDEFQTVEVAITSKRNSKQCCKAAACALREAAARFDMLALEEGDDRFLASVHDRINKTRVLHVKIPKK